MNSFPPCPWWRWIINTQKHTACRVSAAVATFGLLFALGCRQDMHNQPKFYPQRGTEFFSDGRSARPQMENTVARSQLHEDAYFYTGMQNGQEGNALPFPITMDVMARGQERYNIYCTPCHSRVGNGAGMIVQRGYAQAGNFHTARLQSAPLGHFFNVISNGYGSMPDYSAQLTPADRWAVVAYIKALQLSQNATEGEVASGQRVERLGDIAEREGLPQGFANEWTVPSTAVTGTPNQQPYVLSPEQMGNAGGGSGQFPAQGAASSSHTIPSINPVSPGVPHGQTSTGYPQTPTAPCDTQ